MTTDRTGVLVVDTSADPAFLRRLLSLDHGVRVVAEVRRPADALGIIRRERPHVTVVHVASHADVDVIEQIMGFQPTPVLALTGKSGTGELAVEAMVAGATQVLPYPDVGGDGAAAALHRSVRMLRGVHVVRHQRARLGRVAGRRGGLPPVVALAASTGGPPAIATLLCGLAGVAAGVLVVQHLHHDFLEGFVSWLRSQTKLPVALARDGEPVRPGTVTVGPGHVHLTLSADGRVALRPEPATIHRPSADALFTSVAASAGSAGVGVLLTGMGSDGADGLLRMREAGALTIAQDQASCAVFGMPAAAIANGAAARVLPLGDVAAEVAAAVGRLALRTPGAPA
jgi:two-component system, chemotaxis family, protein-glutamate methylesterase/glutaminase